jgi:hypothetical protein
MQADIGPCCGYLSSKEGRAAADKQGMKTAHLSFVCSILLIAGAARAETGAEDRVIGRVRASYVRVAPGVFVEQGHAASARSLPRWVEVEPLSGGTPVMAIWPEDEKLAAGAEVVVRIAGRQTRIFPVPELTRVVEVLPATPPSLAHQLAGKASLTSSQ